MTTAANIVEILIPSILRIGGGSFAEAASLLHRLACRSPLIVTDPYLAGTGLSQQLQDQLHQAGIESGLFHETVADPTTQVVEAGVRFYREGGHDSLISLGGGSPIDTAKAIGLLIANGGTLRDYKVPNPIPLPGPTHLAIPTTAGTGSEVSRFTVIAETNDATDSEEKMLIAGAHLVPSAAIVDYELTLTMPARLTADTGTDALTHAIESYVSRRANAFTDALALAAMRTIWRELPTCVFQPSNRPAREAVMLAATQAGMAFSNASVALVHGMSRPLGAHFHIAHGLSNAMLLPVVTAFSANSAMVRYAECARTMTIADNTDSDPEAVTLLIRALYTRNAQLEVPSPKKYGIDEARYHSLIPMMAAQALTSGSPQNNPRIPTAEEIEQLYRQLWQE
jgi:alcohol dehydrogenase class IV